MKAKIIRIKKTSGTIISGLLSGRGNGKGIKIVFDTPIHGETVHHLNGRGEKINNYSNLIGCFIARNYKDGDELFESVAVYDENFEVIDCENVRYPEVEDPEVLTIVEIDDKRFCTKDIIELTTIAGEKVKCSLTTLLNSNQSYSNLYKFKYTKNEHINELLSTCGEPKEYDHKLADLFANTETRIKGLKADGFDIYVCTKTKKIKAVYNFLKHTYATKEGVESSRKKYGTKLIQHIDVVYDINVAYINKLLKGYIKL